METGGCLSLAGEARYRGKRRFLPPLSHLVSRRQPGCCGAAAEHSGFCERWEWIPAAWPRGVSCFATGSAATDQRLLSSGDMNVSHWNPWVLGRGIAGQWWGRRRMPLSVGLRRWEALLWWCTVKTRCLVPCWLMGKGEEGVWFRGGWVASRLRRAMNWKGGRIEWEDGMNGCNTRGMCYWGELSEQGTGLIYVRCHFYFYFAGLF